MSSNFMAAFFLWITAVLALNTSIFLLLFSVLYDGVTETPSPVPPRTRTVELYAFSVAPGDPISNMNRRLLW